MTDTPDKYKSACGKVTFESFFEAKKILDRLGSIGRVYGKSKRRLATKKPKSVYKCPDCGKYHLTSQRNKSK